MEFLEAYSSLRETRKDAVPNVYFLSGNERYLKDKYRQLSLSKLGFHPKDVELVGEKVAEAIAEIEQPDIMCSRRVFVFPECDKVRAKADRDRILSFLEEGRQPENHVVFFESSDSFRLPRNDLVEYLKSQALWVECRSFREYKGELSRWIKLLVRARGAKFSDDIVRELADLCKKDLYLLESEIEKLVLYPGDISLKVLRKISTAARQESLQALYDMVALQNGSKAVQKMGEVFEHLSVRKVVNGLAKYLQQLLVTGAMARRTADNDEIAEALALNPYYVKKLRAASSRFTTFHLTVALNRLAEIDITVRKPGDSKTQLQGLVYTLCERPDKLVVRSLRSEGLN